MKKLFILTAFLGIFAITTNLQSQTDPCAANYESRCVKTTFGEPPAGDIIFNIPKGISIKKQFYLFASWAKSISTYPNARYSLIGGFATPENESTDKFFEYSTSSFDEIVFQETQLPTSLTIMSFKNQASKIRLY